jgi:hypothetical protein
MGKVAGQRVTFRASARMGAIAASLAAAAALLLPTAAFASTMIGSAVGDSYCQGVTADTIQLTSSKPSYAAPTGAITDWFFQAASTDTGSVSLLVWRPDGTGGYNLIAVGPAKNLSDSSSTFDLGGTITVQAGDLIGLRISGAVTCYSSTTTGETFGIALSTTDVGNPIAIDVTGFGQLNVRASVDSASNPVVTTADQCKNGGWQTLTDSLGNAFKNQGDCVSFVRTGGKNPGNG